MCIIKAMKEGRILWNLYMTKINLHSHRLKMVGAVWLTTADGYYVTHFGNLFFLKQINDNEFVKIDKISRGYWFSHISYAYGKKEEIYGPRCFAINKGDNVSSGDDVFILQNGEYENTYIYNCSTRKEFQAPKFIARKSDIVDDNNTPYIIGMKKEIVDEVEDRLFMLINSETLETTGFYSELQDRFVCIKEKMHVSETVVL